MNKSDKALIEQAIPTKAHRRVFDFLYRNRNKWVRVIDLQVATGHNSDEQRLRELRKMVDMLIVVRSVSYFQKGGLHNEYHLERWWRNVLSSAIAARESGGGR